MDLNEFSRALERLGSRYLSEYTRNVERYASFLSDATRRTPGIPSDEGLGRRYLEFVRAEAPRAFGKIAEAGLSYYTVLLNTGIEATNRYFDEVLRVEGAGPERRSPAQAPSALLFRGKPGESVSNAFLVTNHRDQPMEVGFDITECTSDDGTTRVRPNARFSPQTCLLAPRSEQVVQCSLDLSEAFKPGQTHRGEIRVSGFPEMAIRVSVEVDEVEARAPSTGSAARKPRSKKTGSRKARAVKASAKKRGATSGGR